MLVGYIIPICGDIQRDSISIGETLHASFSEGPNVSHLYVPCFIHIFPTIDTIVMSLDYAIVVLAVIETFLCAFAKLLIAPP